MAILVEIIGAPASGKTYLLNYLKKKNKNSNDIRIETNSLKKIFLEKYLTKKTDINYIKKLIYSYYFKKFNTKSNFLFKNEYMDLRKFIIKSLKKDNIYKKIFTEYKKYVQTTGYKEERKFRMLKNFEIDYLGFKNIDSKSEYFIIDEGFFQKIFVKFEEYKNQKFSLKNIYKYLNLVPKPSIIILLDTKISTCIRRAKKRNSGFLYNYKNFHKKNYLNNDIIKYAKKNKILIIKLDGSKKCQFNNKLLIKDLKKYKNFK